MKCETDYVKQAREPRESRTTGMAASRQRAGKPAPNDEHDRLIHSAAALPTNSAATPPPETDGPPITSIPGSAHGETWPAPIPLTDAPDVPFFPVGVFPNRSRS